MREHHEMLDRIVAGCRQKLGLIVETARKEPSEHPLHRLESLTHTALLEIGREMLEEICGSEDGRQGPRIPGHSDVGDGTHELEYKGKNGRKILTIFGWISYERAYYRNQELDDSRWPRDEQLGLLPLVKRSDTLNEHIEYASAVTGSYDCGVEVLKRFLHLDIEYKEAQRECLKMGKLLEEADQEEIRRVFEDGEEPERPNIEAPEAIQITVDGVTIESCIGGGMEVKLGRVNKFALQPPMPSYKGKEKEEPSTGRGRGKTSSKADKKKREEELKDLKETKEQRQYEDASRLVETVLAEVDPTRLERERYRQTSEQSTYRATSRLGPENLGKSLWLAAQKLGVELTALILFVADGSKWCWGIAEDFFPRAIQVLDVFHLAKKVIEVANDLFGARSKKAKSWRREVMVQLVRGQVDEVIDSLTKLSFIDVKQEQARKRLVTYLENNRVRMDYPTYLSKGYSISSAMIEGAGRHVLGSRMKGNGRRWDHERGAEAMARLRALYCSGEWDAHFKRLRSERQKAFRELRLVA